MPTKKCKCELKLVKRPEIERYSVMAGVRLRPSEKEHIQDYAQQNGVTVDTVLRSALVAAGVLAA